MARFDLPAPVVQGSANGDSKKPRFSPPDRSNQLRVRWAKLKRRIGSGSAPDDSLGEPTATESESGSFGRKNSLINHGGVIEDDAAPSTEVDEVVVESKSEWDKADFSGPEGVGRNVGSSDKHTASGTGGAGGTGGMLTGTMQPSEGSSFRGTAFESMGFVSKFVAFWRWRVWPMVWYFFVPTYGDPVAENNYQKEIWYTQKSVHIFGACFLVVNWIFAITLLPHPWSTWNKINNYLIGPIFSIPLVPMACLDWPRRQRWVWQAFVLACIWTNAAGNIIDMRLCNFYVPALRTCANRDFMGTMYYASALPVVGLFALGQLRFLAACSSAAWFILVGATILPERVSYIRNVLNVAIFHGFVIYTHYRKDLADRRMYTMRSELKIQFKAKQKAQINERKTMDSKRRFSSYIFHEVRVPLNTALLAVQNLEGANVFDKNSDQAVEYAALQGSLEMMSQVLNDVLDFSRMEKGGFTSVSRPFSLHKVMRSIFAPLRLDANRRGLELLTALDVRIDEVAKRAAFPDEVVVGEEAEEGDGMVMGDEMRLRQVINNLATNACKFTRAGGNITITTQLVYPSPPLDKDPTSLSDRRTSDTGSSGETYSPRLSTNRLQAHDAKVSPPASEFLVARIEISDTGVGIKPSDMRENRLFSAYVQTEIGRHQGGKGTGLGLSLVRQIVMLSGGRLGVRSKVGEGSTFWVEMPFLVGPQTRDEWDPHSKPATARTSASDKEGGSSASGDSGASAASGSEGSEMRFIPALLKSRGSEALLGSISEAPPGGQAIEMAPTNFRYTSPPASPSLAQSVATTSPFVSAPSPLAPPRRPEAVTHLSAASASSNISSASAPPTAASPIVTATPVKTQMEFADGPLRVLVVDDDVLTRKLMARMMERLGCVVSTAENGAIALDMILNVPEGAAQEVRDGVDPRSRAVKNYDIVFLDNQMPICSGLQVVAQLRSLARDDLVIGVTANALLSDQEEYLEQGASFVLIKPVLEQDLRRYLIVADQRRSEERNRPAGALPPVVMRPPPLILRVDS